MRISYPIDRKCWILLVLGFVLSTVIGTLSHEGGHLLAGWLLGYTDSRLHYGSASPGHSPATDALAQYRKTDEHQPTTDDYLPQRTRLDALEKRVKNERWYIRWGGPVQTMLTGTAGFVGLLLINRRRGKRQQLTRSAWIWVFVALFWLRQLANFFVLLVLLATTGNYGRGDETYLSAQYGLPVWSISAVTAVLSAGVLYYVIFCFIPRSQRLTFITAGLAGGGLGYVLWLELLGPRVLP